jgi:hypothetical protein
VRVPVIGARHKRRPAFTCGAHDRGAHGDVLVERPVAGRRDDDDARGPHERERNLVPQSSGICPAASSLPP